MDEFAAELALVERWDDAATTLERSVGCGARPETRCVRAPPRRDCLGDVAVVSGR